MSRLYLFCLIALAYSSPWYGLSIGSVEIFEPTTGKTTTIANFDLSPGPTHAGGTIIAPARNLGKAGTIFFIQSDKLTGKSYPCSVDLDSKQFVQGPTLDVIPSFIIYDDEQQRLFGLCGDDFLEFSLSSLKINRTTPGFSKYGFALTGAFISKSMVTYEVFIGNDNKLVSVNLQGATPSFVNSLKFDYNVFGLMFDSSKSNVFGVWSYNIATPVIVMQYDDRFKASVNVTLKPGKFHGQDGFLPFAIRESTSEILAVIGGPDDQYACVLSYKASLSLEQCSPLKSFFEDNLFAF